MANYIEQSASQESRDQAESAKQLLPAVGVVDLGVLATLVACATSHVEDIESGLEEGQYVQADNTDLAQKQAALEAAQAILQAGNGLSNLATDGNTTNCSPEQLARIVELDAAIDVADSQGDESFFAAVSAKDEYLETQGIDRDALETTSALGVAAGISHNRYALADRDGDAGVVWSVGGAWSAGLLDKSPTLLTGKQADELKARHPNARIVDVIVRREALRAFNEGANSVIDHSSRSTPASRMAAREAGRAAMVGAGFAEDALDVFADQKAKSLKRNVEEDDVHVTGAFLSLVAILQSSKARFLAESSLAEHLGLEMPTEWWSRCRDVFFNEFADQFKLAGLALNEITFSSLIDLKVDEELMRTDFDELPERFVFNPWMHQGKGGVKRVESEVPRERQRA